MAGGLDVAGVIGTLKRNGTAPVEADPIEQQLALDRKLVANSLQRRSLKTVEAEARREELDAEKSDLERRRIELDRLQLEQEAKKMTAPSSSSSSDMIEFLAGQVTGLQQRLEQMQANATQAQIEQLQKQLQSMASQLETARQAEPTSTGLSALKQQFEEAQALVALIKPDAPPPASIDNPALRAYELKLNHDIELRREEMADRRSEAAAKIALDREMREGELNLKKQQAAQMDRALSDTLPRIATTLQNLITTLSQRNEPVAATTEPVTARPQVAPPPGVEVKNCPNPACGHPLTLHPSMNKVVCPGCFMVWDLTPDDKSTGANNGTAQPDPVESAA